MPRSAGTSTNSGIHPYLKPNFIWPELKYSEEGILCDVNDEEFIESRIEEFRKKRTFYFNEKMCKAFGMNYYQKGDKIEVHRSVVKQLANNHWDFDHLKRWSELKEEIVTLVNDGTSWWTAETLWIKAKI